MKPAAQSRVFRRVAGTRLPTKWGTFEAIGFQWEICNGTRQIESAVALLLGELTGNAPLLRIHSQCLTGDALGSLRCDCGEQLEVAMRVIAHEGCGMPQRAEATKRQRSTLQAWQDCILWSGEIPPR